jgi:hypothetical protein
VCIPYYRLQLSAAYGRIQLAMSQSYVDAQLGRETFHRIENEIAAADNMHVEESARVLLSGTRVSAEAESKARVTGVRGFSPITALVHFLS